MSKKLHHRKDVFQLISGGVWITPMMAMYQTIANTTQERQVAFLHSVCGPTPFMQAVISALHANVFPRIKFTMNSSDRRKHWNL
ncbi:hypothetical protein MHZ92_03120 [Sporosarcina sp. ACRSL]|uniref:hypothetical protein n=1 Tax=Sporosarcina sp. ACRSL TaxID=2918215 RepID=UPI001EF524AC|nr:hypothetical protein [Sporosarcina sp. ACRSL]MCG7343108.1 hypothetical protein [Sporosarcina sp. ACRSL]